MKLIISFSGRADGNCENVAEFLAAAGDKIVHFRDLNVHNCSNCTYECFDGFCKYHDDDIYGLYAKMLKYEKVILIVPMYCGNPSSLYFIFNERCQDFFMHNEDKYEEIISKLYIIGIYGSKEDTPDFIPCFKKWFNCLPYTNRVLGIERHKYGQKMKDSVLDIKEVRERLKEFVE